MKLSEIFNQLTHGELSQIHLGGSDVGVIDESNHDKILSHVNMGLLALYKRFPLKEGRVSLVLEPGKRTYLLDANEVLKVERVYGPDSTELGLNDESDPLACATPSPHSLRVPVGLASGSLEVVYRAKAPQLLMGLTTPDEVEVELPYSHLEPLLLYVASRVHNPIGMVNELNMGNTYYAKYEAACQELEQVNLRVDQGSQNTRLRRNGWA